jgi:hypothetical protein
LTIAAETPAATITEAIFTPRPIVLGQAVFTVLLMAYELITIVKGGEESAVFSMDGYPLKNHVSISNPLSIGYPMDIVEYQ